VPLIKIGMIAGRTIDQKRKLVQAVTHAVCDTLDVTAEKVRIVIEDIAPENYCISGVLHLDKK
jgi:4-oxalocrotonate tautomerase